MNTNRRRFLGALGITIPGFGVVAARFAPPVSVTQSFTPLPRARAGDMLTADKWNALIEKINEYGAAIEALKR